MRAIDGTLQVRDVIRHRPFLQQETGSVARLAKPWLAMQSIAMRRPAVQKLVAWRGQQRIARLVVVAFRIRIDGELKGDPAGIVKLFELKRLLDGVRIGLTAAQRDSRNAATR